MITSLVFYSIAFIMLIISFIKNKDKTKKALKKAYKSFFNLMPALLPMVLIVGIMLTFISTETISILLGQDSGFIGIIIGMIIGSFSFIPGFVAFPLGGTLVENGAGNAQVAAFVSTAMAVGIATIAVEVKYFRLKMTLFRNIVAFLGSFIFTLVIWKVM